MSTRTTFDRETIVEAAFKLTRERGWTAVTARSIAGHLGSSTMPIYSTMSSMEEIERAVRERTESLLLEYQRRPFTSDKAASKAVGYVIFAREERNLFRFLYVDRPAAGQPADPAGAKNGDGATFESFVATDAVPRLAEQAAVALQEPRILKSWIFTHGLAMLVGTGILDLPDRTIVALLLDAGGALVSGRRSGEPANNGDKTAQD